MAQLGKFRYIGLDDCLEPSLLSYKASVENGRHGWGTPFERAWYLIKANYAFNYINAFRRRSNDPQFVTRAGWLEQFLRHPIYTLLPKTKDATDFLANDWHMMKNVIEANVVNRFAKDLENCRSYYDPYTPGFYHNALPGQSAYPLLYMDTDMLLRSQAFLNIAANRQIIDFCREVLGPSAALSWAWAWLSRPSSMIYQNQNWHRDSAEPLNFIRIFIPLNDIEGLEDGPTEIIPATSNLSDFFEPRRFKDDEIAALKEKNGSIHVYAKRGDIYFANTFALHRATPPQRDRGILTLLVTLLPSHRTPYLQKVNLSDLPQDLRSRINANKSFFRRLVR